MAKTIAGKTYEVFTADGKRWIYDSTHDTRAAALQHAEGLLAAGKDHGVRVTAEDTRKGGEEVIFEERIDRAADAIKLVAIDEAPNCRNLADFYRFQARRTIGRLLRRYLDDRGMTALEFLFKPGELMMFERNDRLFAPAIQRIATIQARGTDKKPAERGEELFKIFEDIKKKAKKASDEEKYPALLEAKGINSLVLGASEWEKKPDQREFATREAIARHISSRGDWDGKLLLLINLLRDQPSKVAIIYADEVIAEILDGAQAVRDVLGGQADAATANRQLIHLARGSVVPPRNPISCIVELNEAIYRLGLPVTSGVLLERVQTEIGGIGALTREGPEADRDAFVGLARELFEGSGIMGGPDMCEALIKRARMTLKTEETDLTVEQAIDHLLDLMPNRAVRVGFLLQLAASPLGESSGGLIQQALDRVMQQLSFLASLIPDTSEPEVVAAVVEGLKDKMTSQAVSVDWRQNATMTLDELVARAGSGSQKDSATDGKKGYRVDDGKRSMTDPTGERRTVTAGETIFQEGEVGELAYLIVSGEVEIYRTGGNQERVLATLGRGEIIGEMSLIDNQPRVASARALQDSDLTVISQESLQRRLDRLDETDRVLRRLIAVLVSRIRGQADSPE